MSTGASSGRQALLRFLGHPSVGAWFHGANLVATAAAIAIMLVYVFSAIPYNDEYCFLAIEWGDLPAYLHSRYFSWSARMAAIVLESALGNIFSFTMYSMVILAVLMISGICWMFVTYDGARKVSPALLLTALSVVCWQFGEGEGKLEIHTWAAVAIENALGAMSALVGAHLVAFAGARRGRRWAGTALLALSPYFQELATIMALAWLGLRCALVHGKERRAIVAVFLALVVPVALALFAPGNFARLSVEQGSSGLGPSKLSSKR